MVKRDLAGYDPQNAFPNHLPEVSAPPQKIDETEQSLAIVLDPEHRAFLSFADGWKCFHQHVTLLSTSELIAGPLRDAALEAFEYAPEALEELGRTADGVLPIAASLEQGDVFVMPIDDGVVGQRVYWLAEGEVIDTFESFGQYFVSMIEYTRRRISKLAQSAPQA